MRDDEKKLITKSAKIASRTFFKKNVRDAGRAGFFLADSCHFFSDAERIF